MLKTLQIQGKFKDDFKYENTFFEIQPKITQKDIFGRRSRDLIIDISFLHKIMQLDKYPKIPKSDIFAPKFKSFYFATNFASRQIQGHWFPLW